MSTTELKISIFELLATTRDSKILKSIYALLKKQNAALSDDFTLSAAQKKELDKRMKNHNSGKSKSYTWEEAKKMIRGGA